MKWKKKGLVFVPDKEVWWQQAYGMLPTPLYLKEENILRIYFSSACRENFCRITYMDLDPENPLRIITNPQKFILDIGEPGTFDDCGLIPTSIIKINSIYHLYYSGYQRHFKVPYSILSGVAVSDDGKAFSRVKKVPILERTHDEMNIRSAPFIFPENNQYHMWYTAGNGWKRFETGLFAGRVMPTYTLKYGSSPDGLNWHFNDDPVIQLKEGEFGISRPYVVKQGNAYQMFYSIRSVNEPYKIGFALSSDKKNWVRHDSEIGISVSGSGWDSEMLCYPAVISINQKTYLFYNGNKNGKSGFGYAELE